MSGATAVPGDNETVDDEALDEGVASADGTDTVNPSAQDSRRRIDWRRIITSGVLPALAMMISLVAGYLKWMDTSIRDSHVARTEAVQAARDGTVTLLSYTPAEVDRQLGAARDLLTGEFRDSYTKLTNDVVIPGAKQQQITAVATVPAAAPVSATSDHAVVLVFVDQTTTIGSSAPTALTSTVRITLDKVDGRWLISQFDPV
jgi:Mce-associated membrane protein